MTRVTLYRVLVIVAAVLALEVLCLTGVIDKITMQPPHRILYDLGVILISGKQNAAIAKTLTNASIALVLALIVGVATAVSAARPSRRCARRSIRCSRPITRCRSSPSIRC